MHPLISYFTSNDVTVFVSDVRVKIAIDENVLQLHVLLRAQHKEYLLDG